MLLFTLYESVISIYLHMTSTRKFSPSVGNILLELCATRYPSLEKHKKVTERKSMYLYV